MKELLDSSGADYKRHQSRWVALCFIEAYEILNDDASSGCENCDLMHSSDSVNDWSTSAYKELRSKVAAY
jgi:hypothetical protein